MSPVEGTFMLGLVVLALLGAALYRRTGEIHRAVERLSRGEAARAMLGRGEVQARAAVSGQGASPPAERATRPARALGSVGALSLPNYPEPVRLPPLAIDDPPDSDKAPEVPPLGADVGASPSLDGARRARRARRGGVRRGASRGRAAPIRRADGEGALADRPSGSLTLADLGDALAGPVPARDRARLSIQYLRDALTFAGSASIASRGPPARPAKVELRRDRVGREQVARAGIAGTRLQTPRSRDAYAPGRAPRVSWC